MSALKPRPAPATPRRLRCPQCDALCHLPPIAADQTAYCPRCQARLYEGRDWSLIRLSVLALTLLLLLPLALFEPLLQIRLFGVSISTSLWQGIVQMVRQGDWLTAAMVAWCVVVTPLLLPVTVLALYLGQRWRCNLRPLLRMLSRVRAWIMLDIYLVGLAVACIKVREYATIDAGPALLAYIAATLLLLLMLIHLNMEQLWRRCYPQPLSHAPDEALQLCEICLHSAPPDAQGRCQRCRHPLHARQPHSLQKSWAALLAAMVMLLPANLLPISILYVNGTRIEDTILSGIASLAQGGNLPIAAIVFIASIVVPLVKVAVLLFLLLGIQFRQVHNLVVRMRLLRLVTWIGRWSMLDLFVIALMMSLIDRDQLLSFTMGPAALYFGAAVLLTILAVEWLDSRLIWDTYATNDANAREYAE
ncbi:Paraquat-inducible protein A [Edwardsiella hoshinae]|uniref:Inner membrane protein yebS n=1 Tax=Edwardsiella hoshinae TaxID=93378 RepID=A0A376DFF6_9GAMM|nr:membrane integrity lipid transport subunit YebS [Edwardsiella hoshinae]AOV96878.1 Paraquat-inducible protein A [Edwardsiella hoshinae]QPR27264.1 membrane integrity lipid transport subunit YebS [Edwardsiella hoshinae]STC87941.1 Inner membrane protein yebS [Edwardsiella hoshinae]